MSQGIPPLLGSRAAVAAALTIFAGLGIAPSLAYSPLNHNDCELGVDAGGSHAEATPLGLPVSNCAGDLTPVLDEADWYRFPVDTGDLILFEMQIREDITPNFQLCLYSPGGVGKGCSSSLFETPRSVIAAESGDWRIVARTPSCCDILDSQAGTYVFSVSAVAPPVEDDCGSGGDAPNAISQATTLSPPVSCWGTLMDTDIDFYKIHAEAGQLIRASAGDANVCLVPNPIWLAERCGGPPAIVKTSGDWWIGVNADGRFLNYPLVVELGSAPAQDDCGTGGDAGDSFATATLVQVPAMLCAGRVYAYQNDDYDWYKFPAESGDVISATLNVTAGDRAPYISLSLVTPSGQEVFFSDNTIFFGAVPDTVVHVAQETGEWRLFVWDISRPGPYHLTIQV